jgi:hypothetical protein
VKRLQGKIHPGMVMIVTDLPMTPDARSRNDFVAMTTGV